jgi:hypothetical protein
MRGMATGRRHAPIHDCYRSSCFFMNERVVRRATSHSQSANFRNVKCLPHWNYKYGTRSVPYFKLYGEYSTTHSH